MDAGDPWREFSSLEVAVSVAHTVQAVFHGMIPEVGVLLSDGKTEAFPRSGSKQARMPAVSFSVLLPHRRDSQLEKLANDLGADRKTQTHPGLLKYTGKPLEDHQGQ